MGMGASPHFHSWQRKENGGSKRKQDLACAQLLRETKHILPSSSPIRKASDVSKVGK